MYRPLDGSDGLSSCCRPRGAHPSHRPAGVAGSRAAPAGPFPGWNLQPRSLRPCPPSDCQGLGVRVGSPEGHLPGGSAARTRRGCRTGHLRPPGRAPPAGSAKPRSRRGAPGGETETPARGLVGPRRGAWEGGRGLLPGVGGGGSGSVGPGGGGEPLLPRGSRSPARAFLGAASPGAARRRPTVALPALCAGPRHGGAVPASQGHPSSR